VTEFRLGCLARGAPVSVLPVKTVGVMGDGRTHEYVVGLRAVT